MKRATLSTFGLAILALALGACSQMRAPMPPMEKPAQPDEMAALEAFVGSWRGTAQMVSPSPEELKAMMPEGAPEPPSEMDGENTLSWTLDGMFLKGEGWYEMGPDQVVHFVEYYTWDPHAKKYRTWMFSDWGEHGEGSMVAGKDGKSFHMKFSSVRGTGEGTMTFTDDNTMEWTFTERGPMGTMKLKGTTHRQ